jgi:LacI family transcriptional regulator
VPTTPEPDRPKYQQVADRIEAEMLSGAWDGGRMPSVRGIADRYTVSIVTASRAVQVLRDKGLVRSVERSGTFRQPAAAAERWAVALRVTPGPFASAAAGAVRAGFEALAKREAMHLHFDAFPPADSVSAAEAAARQARADGVEGLFLLPSRTTSAADAATLAGCRAADLPVVLLQRNVRGEAALAADLVGTDDVGGAAEATRHLLALGRRRLATAVASPTSTHQERAAGYLVALSAARAGGGGELPECVIRLPDEMPTAAASRHLADRVQRERIDGVVCYHDYAALGLIVELLTRGVRVPADVAVVGFGDVAAGGLFPPGLTTYRFPAERVAAEAVRLMRARVKEPDRPPVRVIVPGRLVVRGSTDPTAGGTDY